MILVLVGFLAGVVVVGGVALVVGLCKVAAVADEDSVRATIDEAGGQILAFHRRRLQGPLDTGRRFGR